MLKRLVETALTESSSTHSVISLSNLGTIGPQLQAIGIDVYALGMRTLVDIPRTMWRLHAAIRRQDPHIVQTWMYHADLLGGVAARLAGVENVIWGIRTTDINATNSRSTALVRTLCARLSRMIPKAIVCAADASRRSHIKIGYDAARMEVVPNGFDIRRLSATPQQRESMRAACGIGSTTTMIGSLGRFHSDKDQQNFVAAAGIVASAHHDVRFLMVGRGLDETNEQLCQWISATGHSERFMLLGERSDVPLCLAAMDIFCLSSRTEGFPNVVGEAMAMGVPCVVTDVGDAAMLVGMTGVVVASQDAAALARGLEAMLALSSIARAGRGVAARGRIVAEFSMERALERFTALYRRLLNEGHGRCVGS